MELKKFGAIDIGSNAMRLLITRVVETEGKETKMKKVSLVRLPIRLGQEAFVHKVISEETADRFVEGMTAYKHLMNVHQVRGFRAFATSAMREAENGAELVDRVFAETGIRIEIISGQTEAKIIQEAHFQKNLDRDTNYIYVDVGGGSTEISILSGTEVVASRSFKMGTVRLLNGMVSDADWDLMKTWIKRESSNLHRVEMIGSGGNINKIYKLAHKEYPQPMLYHELKMMQQSIKRLSFEDRIQLLDLNPDRADVIGHAADIYYKAMNWSDASILHVPKIGLSDGIVMKLLEESNTLNPSA